MEFIEKIDAYALLTVRDDRKGAELRITSRIDMPTDRKVMQKLEAVESKVLAEEKVEPE